MKFPLRLLLLLLIFNFSLFTAFAQQRTIDSLRNVLKTEKEDTNKINTLNDLASAISKTGNYSESDSLAKIALQLAIKKNFKIGEAVAYSNIGFICEDRGNLPEAMKNQLEALKIHDEIGNKKGVGRAYANIGNIYDEQGNFAEALKNDLTALKIYMEIDYKKGTSMTYGNIGIIYFEQGNYSDAMNNDLLALKMDKEIGYKEGMAAEYGNIGNIYDEQGNYAEALKNDLQDLKINIEMGYKHHSAIVYGNIGNIYHEQGNYEEALRNLFQALKMDEEMGKKQSMAIIYMSIGSVYEEQDKHAEALKNELRALKMNVEIGNKQGIAYDNANIGEIYQEQGLYREAVETELLALKTVEEIGNKRIEASVDKNLGNIYSKTKEYTLAKEWLEKGLLLSKESGLKEDVEGCYKSFAELDSATGDFRKENVDYKMYIIYRDSLINKENTKKLVTEQMNYDFKIKQDSVKAVEVKTEAVHQSDEKRQRIIIYSVVGGLVLLSIFLFFIQKEKKKADTLLLNILPAEVATELKANGSAKAKHYDDVTVMFTDFKGFTLIGEQLTPTQLVAEINYCFVAYDNIILKYGIEKIKTIGDAYMAVCGLPKPDSSHAEKVVKACLEIRKFMEEYKTDRLKNNLPFFEARIGINSGSVVAGIVGIKKFAYDIWGDTVNTAARMEQNSEAGKINISGTTYELVKNKFTCTYRGKIAAKNKGEIDMYFVS